MQRKKQNGSAMIEFVIILPILCTLLFGILEYSIMLYDLSVITDASRQGARYGTVFTTAYPSTSAVVTYTANYCSGHLVSFSSSTASPTITATPSGTPAKGQTLNVTVNYTYTDLVIHNFIGTTQTHNLSATTVMPYE